MYMYMYREKECNREICNRHEIYRILGFIVI